MTIAAVGTLFPAIPLAIVALNFRYTSLAGLMRNISSQMEASHVDHSRQAILNEELNVMRRRMVHLVHGVAIAAGRGDIPGESRARREAGAVAQRHVGRARSRRMGGGILPGRALGVGWGLFDAAARGVE